MLTLVFVLSTKWRNDSVNTVMSEHKMRNMAKSRAFLTETEREQIAGEHGDERKYQATARVRRRIKDELPRDVGVLEEHHPELLEELREVVCEDG